MPVRVTQLGGIRKYSSLEERFRRVMVFKDISARVVMGFVFVKIFSIFSRLRGVLKFEPTRYVRQSFPPS